MHTILGISSTSMVPVLLEIHPEQNPPSHFPSVSVKREEQSSHGELLVIKVFRHGRIGKCKAEEQVAL